MSDKDKRKLMSLGYNCDSGFLFGHNKKTHEDVISGRLIDCYTIGPFDWAYNNNVEKPISLVKYGILDYLLKTGKFTLGKGYSNGDFMQLSMRIESSSHGNLYYYHIPYLSESVDQSVKSYVDRLLYLCDKFRKHIKEGNDFVVVDNHKHKLDELMFFYNNLLEETTESRLFIVTDNEDLKAFKNSDRCKVIYAEKLTDDNLSNQKLVLPKLSEYI